MVTVIIESLAKSDIDGLTAPEHEFIYDSMVSLATIWVNSLTLNT